MANESLPFSNSTDKICSIASCGRGYLARGYCRLHYYRIRRTGSPDSSPRVRVPAEIRFWKHVNRTSHCWLWTGASVGKGYGVFSPRTHVRHCLAHRFSYEMAVGPIPPGMMVLHACDTPRCVNPRHLFLGTAWDNEQDKIRKGRRPSTVGISAGEKNPHAKLTAELVLAIRSEIRTTKEIAATYGVSMETVRDIVTRRTWKHI